MATARGEEYDKINGLDSGADDYLVKPFGMMEMVSRVRAVLRRSNPERTERAMEFHGITIDPASHRVTANGREVTLTLKEYELLLLFDASEDMLTIGNPALRIISYSFLLAGVNIIASSSCQAFGFGMYSLYISAARPRGVSALVHRRARQRLAVLPDSRGRLHLRLPAPPPARAQKDRHEARQGEEIGVCHH